ncbi:MAG: hypothetical protein D6761_04325, partial [Candidatus Dadabacteria bacterium]
PMLSGPGPLATTSPAPVSGLLTASDVDGDPLTFGVFTSPTSGAAAVTAVTGTMAEVWYTPIAGNTGNDTFWVSVSDGTAEVTAAVTVFVEFPPFVRYVSAVASGLADGSSWADATDVIQDAVDAAAANGGGQVWIASGTWYTTDTTPLLTMADGVDVYGGFSGFEQSVDERGQVNPFLTVLSGDSDLSTTHSTGDAYHVVVAANATLDGLTITGGNAVGSSNDRYGGGILSIGKSLAVHNVVIRDSYATLYGGAIYQNGGSLDLDRVRLEGSQSGSAGGALYSQSGVGLTIARSALYGNQSGAGGGGGIYLYQTDMDMFDVIFDGNSTSGPGGAASFSFDNIVQMVNVQFSGNSGGSAGALSLSSSGPVTAVNVHFVGNSSTQFNGGAIQISSSSMDLRNVTFWQNTSAGAGPDVFLAGAATFGVDASCTQSDLSVYGSNNTQVASNPFTTPAASGEFFFEQSHLCADWGDNATATTAFAAAGTDWTWWTSDISNMTTEFDSGTVAAGRLFHPADVWIEAFSASASLLSWTTNDQATNCAITNSADATVIPLGPIDFPSGSTSHTFASGTVVTLNCLSPVAYSKSATAVVP